MDSTSPTSSTRTASRSDSARALKRPRPRPILSCLECRRKKLRCDRQLPCNQCDKLGRASECNFEDRQRPIVEVDVDVEAEQFTRPRKMACSRPLGRGPRPNDDSIGGGHDSEIDSGEYQNLGVVEALQARVTKLERALGLQNTTTSSTSNATTGSDAIEQASSKASSRGVLVAKDSKKWKSRYHSQGQKLHLLFEFPDALRFLGNLFAEPGMVIMMKEFRKFVRARVKDTAEAATSNTLSRMQAALPARAVCEKHVELYMSLYENALRVLHKPSFRREYEEFWAVGILDKTFDPMIPQILLIIALTSVSTALSAIESAEPSPRNICLLVGEWLRTLPAKHKNRFSTLQIYCLLLMSQQIHMPDADELWNSSGLIVRLAMTLGLHRDPAEFPTIPVFEAEQRRRLWMTVVELDMQISSSCGFPTMTRNEIFTVSPPLNIDDADVFPGMTDQPEVKSIEQWTDMSCQVALASCVRLRLDCIVLAVGVSIQSRYEEAVRLGGRLEGFISTLPDHLRVDDMKQTRQQLFILTVTHSFIHKGLFYLYRPFFFSSSNSRFSDAKIRCAELSLDFLHSQELFDPSVADALETENTALLYYLSTALWRWVFMQASLVICLQLKALNQGDSSARIPAHQNREGLKIYPLSRHRLIRSVDQAVDAMLRKHRTFGSDLRDPLCLSVILQSLRTCNSAEQQEAYMREGSKRVTNECGYTSKDLECSCQDSDAAMPLNQGSDLHATEDGSVDWDTFIPDPYDFSFGLDSGLAESSFEFLADWNLQEWELNKQ